MAIHTLPSSVKFIQVTYLEPLNISGLFKAEKFDVAASTQIPGAGLHNYL